MLDDGYSTRLFWMPLDQATSSTNLYGQVEVLPREKDATLRMIPDTRKRPRWEDGEEEVEGFERSSNEDIGEKTGRRE